ncbi:MAG: fucose isomerase [Thermoprotei archaeon]|nr:MAG: fucose isomerase [Thermoprotei archaeon]
MQLYPDTEFRFHDVEKPEDALKVLEDEAEATGFLVFILNCIAGLARFFLRSGKPVIAVAETYGGSGEYLLDYPRAREEGYPVVGISARDIASDVVLRKVRLLTTIHKLRNSRVLFVVSPAERWLVELEYPLSIDLYSSIKSVAAITGITPIVLDVREFREKYYEKVKNEEVEKIAEKWIREAKRVDEEVLDEVKKSAKLYIALRNAARDYGANAVAINCIVLRNAGFIDAWPCLGYMELWNDGIAPVCEADPYSAALILAIQYLTGRPSFIVDVAIDEVSNEAVYYHCYAPTRPYGDERKVPYVITTAHLGVKHASIYVELPTDEVVTAVGFSPEERLILLHTAKVTKLEYSPHACSVKLIAKTNTRAIVRNWRWRSGWHRVIVFGDYREEISELATLLGLKVLEEDKGW